MSTSKLGGGVGVDRFRLTRWLPRFPSHLRARSASRILIRGAPTYRFSPTGREAINVLNVTSERDWRFLYQLAASVIVFLNETHPLCKTDNLFQMSLSSSCLSSDHQRVCLRPLFRCGTQRDGCAVSNLA
jgi:hypothetical protein